MANTYHVDNKDIYFLGKKATYTGDFAYSKNGPHGNGTAKLENGDTFKGCFKNGDPEYGTYTFANGSYVHVSYYYKPFTKHNRYTIYYSLPYGYPNYSITKQTYSNGFYEGEFKNGNRDGIGKYSWPKNGESYCGGWKEGKKHGVGKYTYKNGNYDWDIWADGKCVATLEKYRKETEEDNSKDYDDDYDTEYDREESTPDTSRQDYLFSRALERMNDGHYEDALEDIRSLRSTCDDDDYTCSDGSRSYNLQDLEDDLNESIYNANNDDDDEYDND